MKYSAATSNSPPLTSTLFPYTTLFRSRQASRVFVRQPIRTAQRRHRHPAQHRQSPIGRDIQTAPLREHVAGDRKSTRLNSSHLGISYAVFFLKKKKYQQ